MRPIRSLLRVVGFSARVVGSIPAAIVGRPFDVLRQLERALVGGLLLSVAAGLSVGLVGWLQGRRSLAAYDLEATLPGLLMAGVAIETGPILASLLLAGRLGAGIAAEVAAMVMAEEIDAREVLGAATIPSLVAPRVLACALAAPLLTVVVDLSAFLGGLAAEAGGGNLSALAFANRSLDFVSIGDVLSSTLKTTAFGALVGLVACGIGLSAVRSAEAVGRAATRGVVASMAAVFLANAALVPIIHAVRPMIETWHP